ncbi:MAG: histidine utilization repressor [Aquamicrobium sp.]|uniref:histidine utilization repressor n=1 Tax=Aquamicrobium sp. TaxID=1872579 RepID=UPI00349E6AE9|nr:histidine utilization repressor [Aquamicrobium sp.]MCO5155898.1 histidine utilization repressor [Aquamicrobium sp.]
MRISYPVRLCKITAPHHLKDSALNRAAKEVRDTLAQRIKAEFETNIMSGAWPPGYKVPSEHELMNTYACSRMTVNNALARLAESGLIERRRRLGSFVAFPGTHSTLLKLPDIQGEINSRGQAYRYELLSLSRRSSTPEDMARLGVNRKVSIIALVCRHFANNVPLALEDRLINVSAVPQASIIDFTVTPPSTWLLTHIPWTESEHRIRCLNADEKLAATLQLRTGAACLVVERRTKRSGEIVTHVEQTVDGSAYELKGTFTFTG